MDVAQKGSRQPSTIAEGFLYGEGPRWHHGELWFSDMLANVVYRVSTSGSLVAELQLDRPSGLGFLPDGSLLAVGRAYTTPEGKLLRLPQLVRRDAKGLTQITELPDDGSNLNDMVVSASGLAYLDLYGRDGRPQGVTDEILLVRPDGSTQIVADELALPNGMVITDDGSTLVVSETYGNRITAFTIYDDGRLGERRTLADDVPTPDGLCLDAEGCLWTGSFTTGQFLRVDAKGTIVDRITVPSPQWAVAPMFGGDDRRTLFMITAETTVEGWPYGRSKGWLLQIQLDVGGAGVP